MTDAKLIEKITFFFIVQIFLEIYAIIIVHRQNSIRKCTIYRDFGRTCINLNILECKLTSDVTIKINLSCINLNILECKCNFNKYRKNTRWCQNRYIDTKFYESAKT